MKKLILLICAFVSLHSTFAQRYLTEVFSSVTKDSNIVYGQNYEYYSNFAQLKDVKMDVYRPDGDVVTDRPVIILMHAGSFLPESVTGFAWGNKNQNCVVELCNRFAKRGYVAISLSYRIGWNAGGDQETRSKTIIQAVYRAMQDAKTCVRFLKNNYASGGNTYGIDTNKIVIGGTNSGAYVAVACGNLNKVSELSIPKFLDSNLQPFINQSEIGDFDGFGGTQNNNNYSGISSNFRCVLALGGAAADLSLIEAGEPPVIAFHGVNEVTTPYNTDIVITSTGQSVVEVSGAGDFMPEVVTKGSNAPFTGAGFLPGPPNRNGNGQTTAPVEGLYPFYNQGFEPWMWYNGTNPAVNPSASMSKAMLYIDTIMGYTTPRLYRLLIDAAYTSVEEQILSESVEIFPNPAVDVINIKWSNETANFKTVELVNLLGEVVKAETFSKPGVLSVADVSAGVYVIRLVTADGKVAVKKVNIE